MVNAGLSGDTSGGGVSRIDYWLNRPVDVFVLELGINDALRGIRPALTGQNLQLIIDKVKIKNPDARLVLMGVELPAFIPGAHASAFRGIFKTLADNNHMAYVPFFLEGVAGQGHLNMRDGLHSYAEGYKVIAGKVWPVIRLVL
ncbi:GDSL-type esterase/lipase family protein [Mucilaginibacter limnophilus]|uniref:GDSL-type esterase/lipase family protein n=1 Tax=Mucilaginibacter limnophilus TaxID=1932778 RepID=UPI00197B8C18|nr:GDSL-type esterase/lipase family protein [Mucilaginibacter limnophilus]